MSNGVTLPCARFALVTQLFDFFIGQVLDADEHVLDFADTDQLVELNLNGCAVAVLRILDQKNHQKSDDSRSRVDDELPCVRVMEDWPRRRPYHDDTGGKDKSR